MSSYQYLSNPFRVAVGRGLLGVVISFLILQIGQAQQWPLGHQPVPYTVPQYRPANPNPNSTPSANFSLPAPTASPGNVQQSAPSLDLQPRHQESNPGLSYPLHEAGVLEQVPAASDPNSLLQPNSKSIQQLTPLPAPPADSQLPAIQAIPQSSPGGNSPPAASDKFSAQLLAPKTTPFGLDYTIYRDPSPYPVDPRKPCNACVRPHLEELSRHQWPGKNGRPYQDREPGGCECSSASRKHKSNFSTNWPAPFSAVWGPHLSSDPDSCSPPRKHLNDRFNHLAEFKLIDYRRTDNGYEGVGADPYGCVGEGRAAGFGF